MGGDWIVNTCKEGLSITQTWKVPLKPASDQFFDDPSKSPGDLLRLPNPMHWSRYDPAGLQQMDAILQAAVLPMQPHLLQLFGFLHRQKSSTESFANLTGLVSESYLFKNRRGGEALCSCRVVKQTQEIRAIPPCPKWKAARQRRCQRFSVSSLSLCSRKPPESGESGMNDHEDATHHGVI